MVKKVTGLVLVILVAISLVSCTERIDAGYEGIKVNLYGTDKGVDDVTLVTGRVWYNPFLTSIHEFPTYVQTYDYHAFTVNTKDGSVFTVDPTMSVSIVGGSSPKIFKKYRKNLDDIMSSTFANHIKDVYRIEFNKYSTNEVISSREKFEEGIQNKMRDFFKEEGFQLEQLTSGISYPKEITDAINLKNRAEQDAIRVEQELRIVEAEAKKLLAQAEAESKANELKQRTLTPLIIQYEFIQKWDGKTPLYGNSPMMFKNVN